MSSHRQETDVNTVSHLEDEGEEEEGEDYNDIEGSNPYSDVDSAGSERDCDPEDSVWKYGSSPPESNRHLFPVYSYTRSDILRIYFYLLSLCPSVDVVQMILDWAKFWEWSEVVGVRFFGFLDLKVNEYDVEEEVMKEVAMGRVEGERGRLMGVEFVTVSRDQGWGGEPNCKGPYDGSYTWFEAGILRPSPEGTIHLDINSHGIKLATKASTDTSSTPSRTYTEIFPLTLASAHANTYGQITSQRALIQRNVRASKMVRTHVNVWDLMDGEEWMKAWVRTLKTGDVVFIMPKAKYAGWFNDVSEMTVSFGYSVL